VIYSGDHNQPNDAAGYIDRILRHADSISIRIRRGLTRCPAARFRHSDHGSCAASRTCFDHHCRNRGCAGLEEDSAAQRGLACALNSAGHPARSFTSHQQSSTIGERRAGCDSHCVLRLFPDRAHPIGTEARQSSMALGLWILCGRARRSLRNEWPAPGRLWSDATLVCTTFSRNLAGVFLPASLIGMAGYWFAGLWVPAVTHYYLVALPATLAAVFWGRVINHRLHGETFLRYIYLALICIGTLLVIQATTGRL